MRFLWNILYQGMALFRIYNCFINKFCNPFVLLFGVKLHAIFIEMQKNILLYKLLVNVHNKSNFY